VIGGSSPPEFDGWFAGPAPYPVRTGNTVRPLIDGEPAFRRICEAIESARSSVWTTVTFLWDAFEMPDGHGSFFDVLGRAARRGLDVRAIFWRPGEEMAKLRKNAFWGSAGHLARLEAAGSRILARWDRSPSGYCQHQKSWLIDAGHAGAVAIVGGINLNPHSVVAPGHHGQGHNHDVYVEISGPSTMDVHHNFVQRWNNASERDRGDGLWGETAAGSLPAVLTEPRPQGSSVVQIQRTMPNGHHHDGSPRPAGPPAETTIFDQYRVAIAAARRSIYIENQALDVTVILEWLREALERDVEVVVVLPCEPEPIRYEPQTWLNAFADLAAHENFTLAGLAGTGARGDRHGVYVHSKLMLIDDQWATIGSCNLHAASLFRNAELNASFWDPVIVRQLRCQLFAEHIGQTTEDLGTAAAHRRFGRVARQNRLAWNAGATWQGLAFSLDPADYARQRFVS
jgi:cardiolipin synthase A/B